MKDNYHPEPYWTAVANRILQREDNNVIAGDDEPYYRYKRKKFLKLLGSLDFSGKVVLELGPGPGGNLNFVSGRGPKRLVGADISEQMLKLSKVNNPTGVELVKIDGEHLPFKDDEFDLTFTATVLQHNTDEAMLRQIVGELCRVTRKELSLFEKVESTIKGDELCLGRPVSYYEEMVKPFGFRLKEVKYINLNVSFYVSGAIRKLLNPSTRQMPKQTLSYFFFVANMIHQPF